MFKLRKCPILRKLFEFDGSSTPQKKLCIIPLVRELRRRVAGLLGEECCPVPI